MVVNNGYYGYYIIQSSNKNQIEAYGWVGGWKVVKAGVRIAYSKKKLKGVFITFFLFLLGSRFGHSRNDVIIIGTFLMTAVSFLM